MTPSFDSWTSNVGGTSWYHHGDLKAGLLQQIDRSIMFAITNHDNNQATGVVNQGAADALMIDSIKSKKI